MTRPYYTDPLEAAYMAKHYGMRFLDRCLDDDSPDDADDPRSDTAYEADCGWGKARGRRYYVHADSLPLLAVMAGDMVTNTHGETNRKHRPCSGLVSGLLNNGTSAYVETSERHNGSRHFCECVSALRIIQRDGKAFFSPEQEGK